MEYIRRTFRYMFRSPALLLACLPAALALGIFTKPMASLSYLTDYAGSYVRGFSDVFWLVFNGYATRYVYPLFIIFATLVFSVSFSFSVIEKHFRVGKLQPLSSFKQINIYLLPVVRTLFLLSLVLALYGMVQTGLITLLHFIISGAGYPTVVNLVIAAVLSLGLFVFSAFAACSAMYWTPMMVLYGFSFRDAATSSVRLLDGKTGGVLCGLTLPFLIVAVAETLFSFIGNAILHAALAVLLYLFLIIYVVVFVMTSMFGLSGLERRDEVKRIGGRHGI